MNKGTNQQSAEFWQGYRDGMREIISLGIIGLRGKYWPEFEGDTKSNHVKGMLKALEESEKRLSAMNDRYVNG